LAQLAYYEKQSAPLEKLLSLWLHQESWNCLSSCLLRFKSLTQLYLPDFFYLEFLYLNAIDNNGWNAIMMACSNGHKDVVKSFLNQTKVLI